MIITFRILALEMCPTAMKIKLCLSLCYFLQVNPTRNEKNDANPRNANETLDYSTKEQQLHLKLKNRERNNSLLTGGKRGESARI